MRALIMAALFSLSTTLAFADASVAGHWKTNAGSGVTIDMRVMPDGKWNSETRQGNNAVRRMSGSYTQTPPSGNGPGEMVFTPTSASTSSQNAMTERDSYTLSQNGQELRLTSGNDTMVFEKQSR